MKLLNIIEDVGIQSPTLYSLEDSTLKIYTCEKTVVWQILHYTENLTEYLVVVHFLKHLQENMSSCCNNFF